MVRLEAGSEASVRGRAALDAGDRVEAEGSLTQLQRCWRGSKNAWGCRACRIAWSSRGCANGLRQAEEGCVEVRRERVGLAAAAGSVLAALAEDLAAVERVEACRG